MKSIKGAARTVGVCVVLAVALLATLLALWYRGDPDAQQVVPAAGSGVEVSGTTSEDFAQGTVGGRHFGWSAADRAAVDPHLLPPQQETFTDPELVRLVHDMRAWRSGSRVAFEIPQTGATLESVIERVETGLGGNISYIGRVGGQGSPHRLVVTVGARSSFAYIGSSRGSYEMVGNREFGWLMTSAGMDRHVDYGKPDYYLPGDARPSDR